jgi:hypothetical protein
LSVQLLSRLGLADRLRNDQEHGVVGTAIPIEEVEFDPLLDQDECTSLFEPGIFEQNKSLVYRLESMLGMAKMAFPASLIASQLHPTNALLGSKVLVLE